MSANVGLQNFPFSGKTSHTKNGTIGFLGLCSDQQLSFFTLLDRTSIYFIIITPRSSNLVENFLFYEYISYRLSFVGICPISRFVDRARSTTLEIGQITKMTVQKKCTHKIKKFSTKFDDLDVTIMRKRYSIQQGEKI